MREEGANGWGVVVRDIEGMGRQVGGGLWGAGCGPELAPVPLHTPKMPPLAPDASTVPVPLKEYLPPVVDIETVPPDAPDRPAHTSFPQENLRTRSTFYLNACWNKARQPGTGKSMGWNGSGWGEAGRDGVSG